MKSCRLDQRGSLLAKTSATDMISSSWNGCRQSVAFSTLKTDRRQSCRTSVGSIFLVAILLAHANSYVGSTLAISSVSGDKIHQANQLNRDADGTGGQLANDIIAIKEGADLDLSCPIVVPDEDMIISWTCENEPANIRSSRIHVTDSGKLRIHSARLGDACNYRCEAANGFGTLSVVIKVIIVDRRLIDKLSRRTNSQSSNLDDRNRQLSSLTTLRPTISGKSVAQLPSSPSGLDHPNDVPVASSSGRDIDIEMQIEPSKISVQKNLTFSLECRIKYAPHIIAPQIIWLKEFMGPKPASLTEALEKNLILLEHNVYYHSLNWPRSVTYSDKSLTASSALLIRQSNYVHSGRYVCLAGYPSAIMNLQLNKAGPSDETTQVEPISSPSEHLKSPLKYKIAHAIVEVDDPEGKLNHKLALEIQKIGQKTDHQTNLFADVILSNSWMRNLTICLCLLCTALMLYMIIQFRVKSKKSTTSAKVLDCGSRDANSVRRTQDHSDDLENGAKDNRSVLITDRCGSVSGIAKNDHKIDSNLLSDKLMRINEVEIDLSTDHVYSEVSYKNDRQVTPNSEPYYKQPKTSSTKSVGNG